MGHTSRFLAAGLAAMLLVGCTAQNHRQQGDESYDRGNMEQAARFYREALKEKDSYGRNEKFMARYDHANSRDAFTQGKRREGGGMYEQAVEQYRKALQFDPQYGEARQALELAMQRAAEKRHEQALKAADLGDLKQAADHLRIALKYDPDHTAALAAQNHLRAASLQGPTDALYQQAAADKQARRWGGAKQKLDQLIAADPNHLSARAARYEAQQQIDSSSRTTGQAEKQLMDRRLVPATQTLQKALDIWPNNTRAQGLLSDTQSLLAGVEELHAAAKKLLAEKQWEPAALAAEKGLEIYPYHEGLKSIQRDIGNRASQEYNRRGDAHLQQNQYEQAAGAYHAALRYQSTNAHARKGLSSIYLRRAGEMDQANRPGAALICRMLAADQGGKRRADADRHRKSIIAMADASVALAASGANAAATHHAEQMAAALSPEFPGHTRQALAVGRAADSRYLVELNVSSVRAQQRLLHRQQHIHEYTVETTVDNPIRDELRYRIDHISDDIDDLKDRAAARKRRQSKKNENYDPDNDPVYQSTWNRVIHRRKQRDHLERRRRREPLHYTVAESHGHPYSIATYEKTAEMRVTATLSERSNGNVLQQWTVSDRTSSTDSMIENANPRIGLDDDPLILPSDAKLTAELRGKFQAALSEPIARRIITERSQALRHQADAERRAGHEEQAMELEIQAAMLMNSTAPQTAKSQIESLKSQLRIQPAIVDHASTIHP